jgi:hypothetical protein
MSGFDLLPMGQKMKVIKTSGREVGKFSYDDEVVILYRIGDTIVQTSIDYTSKKITRISSMSPGHFFKYLPYMSIQSILKMVN